MCSREERSRYALLEMSPVAVQIVDRWEARGQRTVRSLGGGVTEEGERSGRSEIFRRERGRTRRVAVSRVTERVAAARSVGQWRGCARRVRMRPGAGRSWG